MLVFLYIGMVKYHSQLQKLAIILSMTYIPKHILDTRIENIMFSNLQTVADAVIMAMYVHSASIGTELIHGKGLNHYGEFIIVYLEKFDARFTSL